MTKEDLQNFLIYEAEYSEDEVLAMSDYELVDNYLVWNGICGYTEDILEVIEAAFGVELDY
jgi:hypothetical protein